MRRRAPLWALASNKLYYMKKCFLLLFLFVKTSIYSLHFTSADGVTMNFSDFKGKKILIVNTAGSSRFAAQYASLETLSQKYGPSLVVIAFPSNDFGHELSSDIQIKSALSTNLDAHYLLAAKTPVTGANASDVFKWLSNADANGVFQNPPHGDFFKYLIDEKGQMIGVFSGVVDPMDSTIQNAVSH